MSERVFVAGHRGMVGSALIRALQAQGRTEVVVADRGELDLADAGAVGKWLVGARVHAVLLAAARVGGILANATRPAEFIAENLAIALNVVTAAHAADVQKLLFLGSSCIYPRLAPQPMAEEALLTGPLEPTNEPYAIAKIAGIKLCESFNRQYGTDYRSVMPTNLYGPGDNFDPDGSHVIPGLMRRFHDAKARGAESVTVWGTGTPRREFLHVDDLAEACVHVMALPRERYWDAVSPMCSHLNVGTGSDVSIAELARTMAEVVGFGGRIEFDKDKPDGTPRKLLDVSKLAALGWRSRVALRDGLERTYAWFVEHRAEARL